jgi:hypothetical protein
MKSALQLLVVCGCTVALGLSGTGQLAAQGPAGGQSGSNPPFSNIYKRPTLSPYTALGFQGNNPLTGGTLGAMQGLVRQQQQVQAQMQMGVQQSRQINQLQGQVRNIQRVQPNRASESIRPTGHASTFLNLSHFYPGP